ncbi:hypothetical protein ACLOAV_010268 [Pseudogymnoascus australis]
MPSDLILLTGSTGHVGFKVLVQALELGYSVRAAIRDPSKSSKIQSTESIKLLNPGPRLSFVTVPDITVDGAYDEAVKSVKYVIHIASPLPKSPIEPEGYENQLIAPAVKGTLGMLQSVNRTPGIKRVVITGSIASITPPEILLNGTDKVVDESTEAEVAVAPFPHYFVAYYSSKIAAYQATKYFIAKEQPAFDIVTLMPTFVIGKNELVTDPTMITDGSNGLAFRQILGQNFSPMVGCTVHVDDVARAHVSTLDLKVPGNGHFVLNSGELNGTVWGDAINIVARNYPKAVAAGILPNNGAITTMKIPINASKAEKALGIKFLSYEEQIKSVTGHYLELVGAEAA